jgi:hypothetical protein
MAVGVHRHDHHHGTIELLADLGQILFIGDEPRTEFAVGEILE